MGAGFGGLWAARRFVRHGLRVIVLDRNNYHTFFPLLYQVAAAELGPGEIAYPIRSLFRREPLVDFRKAELRELTERIKARADEEPITLDHVDSLLRAAAVQPAAV